ncbi:conserved hypothetical protein [Candidatus Zixiibacteriota bacterium]|nr:conserved hypothetical protein [candidate division Zixibacteria bacterium]
MNQNAGEEYIVCPYCDATLRIPKTQQTLKITCPSCTSVFFHNLPRKRPRINKKLVWGAIIVAVIVLFALLNQNDRPHLPTSTGRDAARSTPSNWISISYGGLVDKNLFTHSGETVGAIITRIPQYDDEFKGLVQPYLEPFSVLCHDVLLAVNGPDTLPFVNIVSHYPVGSEQPAWAALFREGHYQLYYSPTKIRLFLEGTDPHRSFEKNRSVVRHAINDVVSNGATKIDTVEIYVFTNDYATTTIKLNTIPASYAIGDIDLGPEHHSIDLDAIAEFLDEGVTLEAVEVDQNNDLYFYGKASQKQTLAGNALSTADLAVIYRSVFHYGNNSPYISLDKHEDNRFAKVNFGGYLEDTHAGNVVLEADKLFKALSTGIDPNTHRIIRDRITRAVPDFLTEDERSLMENSGTGHTQIRYWFYPDSIGTVTDGSIGAVLTNQFLADVERMDMPLNVSSAVRRTIGHLNNHFVQYESAFQTFRELSTVGRLMALVNWLQGMDISSRVELDELLTVRLPAFQTPRKTTKMLAVTAAAYPKSSFVGSGDIRDNSKVYYISDLLEKCATNTTDKQFLEIAGTYFDNLNADDLAPPQYVSLKAKAESMETTINYYDGQLESLDRQIQQSERTLVEYSSVSINQHNTLVDKYNDMLIAQRKRIDDYNVIINRINNMNLVTNCITSVGGGINLRPKEFRKITRSKTAPKIEEIASLKGKVKLIGKIARAGDWIKSRVVNGGARINEISLDTWKMVKSSNGTTVYSYSAGKTDKMSTTVSPAGGGWKTEIVINGQAELAQYSEGMSSVRVSHSEGNIQGVGKLNKQGSAVVFSK